SPGGCPWAGCRRRSPHAGAWRSGDTAADGPCDRGRAARRRGRSGCGRWARGRRACCRPACGSFASGAPMRRQGLPICNNKYTDAPNTVARNGRAAMTAQTMSAVVKRGDGVEGIEIARVELPTAAPGQAVVDVVATGICGTDVHIAHDEYAHERPVVMGHEVLGVVASVGSPDDAHWVGATVALETYFAACEVCELCRAGRRNLCANRRSIGSFRDGGFASQLLVPMINLHRLPETPG